MLGSTISDIRRVGFRKWLAYRLDRVVRRSLSFQLGILVIFVLLVTFLGALLLSLGTSMSGFMSNLWWAFLRVADPGQLGGDETFWKAVVGTVVIVGGLMVFGTLVSIISSAFEKRLEAIRKGRRPVLQKDHSVILGWSPVVFGIIDQLLSDKVSRPRSVVVLADKSKEEMEDMIELRCTFARNRKVSCRTGRIDNINDLDNVEIEFAREIIVLPSDDSQEIHKSDSKAITALCAVMKTLENFRENAADKESDRAALDMRTNIVLAVYDPDIAKVLRDQNSGNQHVRVRVAEPDNFIAKLLAQAAIMPGLEQVFRDLLSFEGGNEFYIVRLKDIGIEQSLSFEDLYMRCANAVPVGYFDSANELIMDPDPSGAVILTPDTEVIFIAEAEKIETISLQSSRGDYGKIVLCERDLTIASAKVLVLGQGPKVENIIKSLAEFLPDESMIVHCCETLDQSYQSSSGRVRIEYRADDGTPRSRLNILREAINSVEQPCERILLADSNRDPETHDAEILLEILGIREMENARWGRAGGSAPDLDTSSILRRKERSADLKRALIVAEFLDPENAQLVRGGDVGVAIISLELLCDYLVQAVEDPRRSKMFRELMSKGGTELAFLPRHFLINADDDQAVTFADLMWASRQKNLRGKPILCFGYARRSGKETNIVLNPPRDTMIGHRDDLICMADVF